MRGRDRAFLGLLAVVAAITAAYPSSDPDVSFHLAVGRDMVESGRLPETEPFCLVSEGRAFHNHEWGFDAVLWLAHHALGPPGVTLFKAGLAALLFVLTGFLAVRLGASSELHTALCLLFLPLFRVHLEARPHLAAYALAAGAVLTLLALRKGRARSLAWFFGIMVVWTNVHGSFPLGILLWGAITATSFFGAHLRRSWPLLLAGPAFALATFVNPWGLELWAVVLHHAEPAYRVLVPEWKPVSFGQSPIADGLFLLLAGATLLSFLPKPNRTRLDRLALLTTFLVPAMVASKFILGLAVGAVPVLAANLAALFATGRAMTRWLLWGAATASVILVPPHLPPRVGIGLGLDLRDHPNAVLDFVQRHGISGRVFAPFHDGGFLAYAGGPGLRPFIDGRAYVHGLDGISRYLGALADYSAFQDLHEEFRFDFVIADFLDPAFPRLVAGLQDDPNFALIFLDSRYALFVPADNPLAKTMSFRILRASPDPRYLANLEDEAFPLAQDEVLRVLGRPEGETLGRLLRGVLALRQAGLGLDPEDIRPSPERARCDEAVSDFGSLVRSRPDIPMFRYFFAKALACGGRCDEARAEAARAAPAFPDAYRLLVALGRCDFD